MHNTAFRVHSRKTLKIEYLEQYLGSVCRVEMVPRIDPASVLKQLGLVLSRRSSERGNKLKALSGCDAVISFTSYANDMNNY